MYLSVYLSTYLSILSFCLSFYLFCLSARLKTQKFCKTSSISEDGNIKNEAMRRGFLQFSKLTTSKTKQFCETAFKNGKFSAQLTASYLCVLFFSISSVQSAAPATQKWRQVIRSAAPVTQNHLSKPEDVMLQNAMLPPKISAWPPNISDEQVSCTAPATWNSSLQILCKCPTLAIVFGHATNPSHFAHFWQRAESLVPATQNDIWTSKSGPNMWCF